MSVVTNAYQQAAAIGIGKCRNRLGQLTSIGDSVFEVLLLVFAFTNEAEEIAFVIHIRMQR